MPDTQTAEQWHAAIHQSITRAIADHGRAHPRSMGCECGRWVHDDDMASHKAHAVLAVVQPEVDRLRAELATVQAQLAGVWPCTCGHLPERHEYDAAIGRNFCRSCQADTDLHNYEPAAGGSDA